jgi:chemotaxis protein CheX
VAPQASSATKTLVQFDPRWKTILEMAALEVFELMAGTRPELQAASLETPRGEITAMVGLAGALRGVASLRCSKESALQLAALMLGDDTASNPATSRDAMGELCNIIAGNFKAKISNIADYCMLSVPTVIIGENYAMAIPQPANTLSVELRFAANPIWISLVVQTAQARSIL